jgi:O-acetyl-ADP-ribose deacetylase (regulator of RNase III)
MPDAFECTIKQTRLSLRQGDITRVQADAIVNAANTYLAGGGGVDGAIHAAGGPAILAACRQIGGCPTGSAVATTAGNLQAKHIFHAVGPRYAGRPEDPKLLANAYATCLQLAEQFQYRTLAFPSLSTGVYGYPLELAAPIALQTVITHVQGETSLREVFFVLYTSQSYHAFGEALREILRSSSL